MTRIYLETQIQASPQRCFDLSRDVRLHMNSMSRSGERAIADVTSGLMGIGDMVTWEAKHLGFTRKLTSRITVFEPPHQLVDEQVCGPFAHFKHVHQFQPWKNGTLMRDIFEYSVPYGWVGRLIARIILARYMHKLLSLRNQYLKRIAEADAGEAQPTSASVATPAQGDRPPM